MTSSPLAEHRMLFLAAEATLGVVCGAGASMLTRRLPRRYGITTEPSKPRSVWTTLVLVFVTTACALALAVRATSMPDLRTHVAVVVVSTHVVLVACALSAAAIDLEHMILPDELTLAPAAVALLSSPLRAIGFVDSLIGIAVALGVTYLPSILYRRLRGRAGMGMGDVKLMVLAGAWHGAWGALLVLVAALVQSLVVSALLGAFGVRYEIPASVRAEMAELERLAEAGDDAAREVLEGDPMSAKDLQGALTTRLPFGPFLVLGVIEALFFRQAWLRHVTAWLVRP